MIESIKKDRMGKEYHHIWQCQYQAKGMVCFSFG